MDARFATAEADPDGDEVRRETLRGETYVVAPVVMVREGVLNGGFLSAEEIHRSAPGWDGRPVTAPPEEPIHGATEEPSGHPIGEDGEFVSANQNPYLETHVIGHLQSTEFVDDLDGLRAEAWINVERAQAVGTNAVEVLRRVCEGEPLDVSTGYWHGFERQSGRHEGEQYKAIQFDLMPDHLAMLPTETGACSWSDGCGTPRVNMADAGSPQANRKRLLAALTDGSMNESPQRADLYEGSANARSSPRTPEYSGTNSGSRDEWSEVDLTFEAFVSAYADAEDVESVDDLSASDKSSIAARSLNGEPDASTFEELVVLPVVVPSTDELHEGGLLAAKSRAPQTEGINAEKTQTRIDSLLGSEFGRDTDGNTSISEAVGNAVASTLAAFGVRGSATDTGTQTGTDSHSSMNDAQKQALAEATDHTAEDLDGMTDEELTEVVESLAEGDDAGDETNTNTNDSPESGDGGEESSAVEALREELETLTEEIEDLKAKANRDPTIEQKIDAIAANSDHDRETVAEWPDDAIEAAAASVGYAGHAGNRVNYVPGGGHEKPSANADDYDEEQAVEDTASVGVLANMGGED